MVIDPADEPEKIMDTLKLLNVSLKYIYITHCHADHTIATEEIKMKTNATILIHREDFENFQNPDVNLCHFVGTKNVGIEADSRVDEGDMLHIR